MEIIHSYGAAKIARLLHLDSGLPASVDMEPEQLEHWALKDILSPSHGANVSNNSAEF
ncbi:MAG: hypothetical protein HC796_09510 [Synechococcaceae cyanobacterium RL_1_2]|nr:hypothetical protein [Synechococcaceae cyanobacterium RL_1_2]